MDPAASATTLAKMMIPAFIVGFLLISRPLQKLQV
jgi:hypothetical protein